MSLRRRYLTVVEMNSENLLFLHIIFFNRARYLTTVDVRRTS